VTESANCFASPLKVCKDCIEDNGIFYPDFINDMFELFFL